MRIPQVKLNVVHAQHLTGSGDPPAAVRIHFRPGHVRNKMNQIILAHAQIVEVSPLTIDHRSQALGQQPLEARLDALRTIRALLCEHVFHDRLRLRNRKQPECRVTLPQIDVQGFQGRTDFLRGHSPARPVRNRTAAGERRQSA